MCIRDSQEGALGKLIFDDMIYLEFKDLAFQSGLILERIENGEGTIGKLLVNEKLYNDTEQLVEGFNMVTERVVNGEGALGQLLSEDNTVIDDLQDAANELSIAMTKLNSTNGLTMTNFSLKSVVFVHIYLITQSNIY